MTKNSSKVYKKF